MARSQHALAALARLLEVLRARGIRADAAGQRVKLVHPPGYDFYEILRSKLLWGRDSRNRASRPG